MHCSILLLCSAALTLANDSLPDTNQKHPRNFFKRQATEPQADIYSVTNSVIYPLTVTETVTVVEVTVTADCSVGPSYLLSNLRTSDAIPSLVSTPIVSVVKGKFVSGSNPWATEESNSLRTILPKPSFIAYDTSYTIRVKTITTASSTIFSLPTLKDVKPQTSGILNSELGETGQPSQNPLLTATVTTRSSLPTFTPSKLGTTAITISPFRKDEPRVSDWPKSHFPYLNITKSSSPPASARPATDNTVISPIYVKNSSNTSQNLTSNVKSPTSMSQGNIFAKPIDTKPLPAQFLSRLDHPVPRTGIKTKGPLQTNKFYSNLFLGNQQDPVFTFPYSISWVDGTGVSGSHGMACSHIEEKQRQFGPPAFNVSASYYLNPIGIQSMIISARELGSGTKLTIDSMTAFSARASLSSSESAEPSVSFPLVQGMAYITAQYNGATPLLQTGVFFRNVTRSTKKPKRNVNKYSFVLEDGTTWRVYGYKTKGDDLDLQVLNNGVAMSSKPFYGIVQVAKESVLSQQDGTNTVLDDGAGIYPVTMGISGTVAGSQGSYSFEYEKDGHPDGELLMFALPHHVESFDAATRAKQQKGMSLITTTKGNSVLVKGAKWTMLEPTMPTNLGFEPFHASKGAMRTLSDSAKQTIHAAASKEILQDMISATDLNSMYWSGKALAKYASMLYVINDMLGDTKLAQTGLGQLKAAFARFADNKQMYPLVHETAWGGVVSSAAYVTGQALEDYGNTFYNDHHFHYGYHIFAAAMIGHLDETWIAENKDYVNMLARDTSNPSAKDPIFPMWRSFDWYHGHSWATGLFASLDGKNQESTSEDMMHAYGLKMWGKVSGDVPMEARANVQLAVMARSLPHYYLYQSNNIVQPSQFIGNKVAGILFENKVHHTTFFGNEIESIQGIHMIPILPVSTVARKPGFVKEEWDAFFSNGRLDDIDNGWKSIILGNYATIEPQMAYEMLSSKSFREKWLDGGTSLTWLLAYSAALGGL